MTSIYTRFVKSYTESTPIQAKIVDTFLLFVVLTGIIQFVYMIIAGTYPYNAFLASFGTSCGLFCNASNLRIQLHPQNESKISPERAFADFLFSSAVLFFFAICFVG